MLQGYHATSIEDIAQLAGVSRNTFFNYFPNKADVLWAEFDELIQTFEARLQASGHQQSPIGFVVQVLAETFSAHHGGGLPLALSQSQVMGATEELELSGFQRFRRISDIIHTYLSRHLSAQLNHVDMLALGSVLAAIFEVRFTRWLSADPPRPDLLPLLAATTDQLLREVTDATD